MKKPHYDRRCEDCRHFSEKKSLSEQGYVISSLESKCLRCFRYPVPEWVDNWERIEEEGMESKRLTNNIESVFSIARKNMRADGKTPDEDDVKELEETEKIIIDIIRCYHKTPTGWE